MPFTYFCNANFPLFWETFFIPGSGIVFHTLLCGALLIDNGSLSSYVILLTGNSKILDSAVHQRAPFKGVVSFLTLEKEWEEWNTGFVFMVVYALGHMHEFVFRLDIKITQTIVLVYLL